MKSFARVRRFLRILVPAVVAAAFAFSAAAEEKSLLTPDGVLYHVQAGRLQLFRAVGDRRRAERLRDSLELPVPIGGDLASGIIPGTDNAGS